MNRKILVVDDDHKTVDLIRMYLERNDFQVICAHDGQQALQLLRRHQPLLVILDLMLPSLDGLDFTYIVRAESKVPIIMLTARTTEEDKLLGLGLGADDYISKPFSPRELVARVRTVLRRTLDDQEDPQPLCFQNLIIDFMRHEVRVDGNVVHLTTKEFRLLETLARQPGRAFSRLQLVERVFGYDYNGLERTVDVHIKNLRKKIEADPSKPAFIQTVYGIGYKFTEESYAS